jgi:hypothetical protein
MNLVLHVGPHKTGTTFIQHALNDEHQMLVERGIFYPNGPQIQESGQPFPSHSHVLYWLRNWSWASMGLVEPGDYTLDGELQRWIDEAQNRSCHTLFLSSEEFSRASLEEWKTFHQALLDAEAALHLHVDRIDLFYTNRDEGTRLRSMYAEMVKHGLAATEHDASPILESEARQNLEIMASLSEAIDERYHFHRVDGVFEEADDSAQELLAWFEQVLGPEVSSVMSTERPRLNDRLEEELTRELLAFNVLNSPSTIRLPDLFAPRDLPSSDQRAFERFKLFRTSILIRSQQSRHIDLLSQELARAEEVEKRYEEVKKKNQETAEELEIQSTALKDARVRIKEMEESRSWRWTRWIRLISQAVKPDG